MTSTALGIDIGGSGVKAALVDLTHGQLISERLKINTPQPSTPEAVADVIQDILDRLEWKGDSIGVGFPAIIQDGVSLTAANIDKSWIGTNVSELLYRRTGQTCYVLNDADAAGLAERMYGRINRVRGTALLLTLGTGIGSALFFDGILVPNTEFGHIQYRGDIAENLVSNRARKDLNLDYDTWAKALAEFLQYMILLLSPRLIVLGGGISFRFETYAHHFNHLRTPVVSAAAYNDAGIIGAAVASRPDWIEPFV